MKGGDLDAFWVVTNKELLTDFIGSPVPLTVR